MRIVLKRELLGQAQKTVRTYAGVLNRFREYLDQVPLPPATEPASGRGTRSG